MRKNHFTMILLAVLTVAILLSGCTSTIMNARMKVMGCGGLTCDTDKATDTSALAETMKGAVEGKKNPSEETRSANAETIKKAEKVAETVSNITAPLRAIGYVRSLRLP